MAYSDEPVLVTPARRWSPKVVAGCAAVLLLVVGILAVPIYQNHLDDVALHARRGPHQGALYDITVDGAPHTLELGWIAPAFSAALVPAPAPGTTLDASGDFGDETLTWDAAKKCFGPGKDHLNPYAHQKVKLTLRRDGRILWHDTLWLYGVPAGHED